MSYQSSVGLARVAKTRAQPRVAPDFPRDTHWHFIGAASVAVAYFLAARLGEALAFPDAPVSAFWAPNAILFAALLLAPIRQWWLYLLAILPLHLTAQLPTSAIEQVAIQYVFNCTESVLGAAALLWLEAQPRRFDKLSTMVNLIVLGSIAAPLVTSTAMAGAFVALDLTQDFWLTTAARTITNTFATMTLVPLIAHAAARVHRRDLSLDWRRGPEALAVAACLLVAGMAVFILPFAHHARFPALLYAPIPLLLLATVRFGIAGASGSVLLLGALATWGVLHGGGPFIDPVPVHNALSLVLFLNVTCAPLMLLAAVLQERKKATAALHGSETLHRAVLASLQDQLAVVDHAGTVIEINDAWRRGRERGQVQAIAAQPGDNCLAITTEEVRGGNPVDTMVRNALQEVLCGSRPRCELQFSSASDAEIRWFDLSVDSLRRPDRGAVITLSDVTPRMRAELEVQEQQQQLAHLARLAVLGEFAGAIAHEIRQPLTATLANAEAGVRLLASEPADLGSVREILDDIVADCLRAGQVVQRLRSMLRNVEPQRQPLQLNDLVQETLLLARNDFCCRGVIASVELEPNLPSVVGDRIQVQQVILNLVANGCQAMAMVGANNKRLTLLTRCVPQSGDVELVVIDSGNGIDEALLEQIFQPFITTKDTGLGLGLSISRSIILAHGGRLWAEHARVGTGAEFHFTLPVQSSHSGQGF